MSARSRTIGGVLAVAIVLAAAALRLGDARKLCGARRGREIGGARQLFHVPAARDERAGLTLGEHTLRQTQELRLEIGVAHRPLEAADHVLDELLDAPAVLQDDGRADL